MDVLPFINVMLSQPALRVFLSDNDPLEVDVTDLVQDEHVNMVLRELAEYTEDQKLALIKYLRLKAREVGCIKRMIVGYQSKRQIPWAYGSQLLRYSKRNLENWIDNIVSSNYLKKTEAEVELEHRDIDVVINSLDDINRIEDLLPDKPDSSNCLTNKEKSRALLLMTAIPAVSEPREFSKMLEFLLELSTELDDLPELICEACEGQPLVLLLIGNLLSLKPRAYDTWNNVKDGLVKIREPGSDSDGSDNVATNNPWWHVFTYCIHDLPYNVKLCFLYLACYPIGYEIPARSLTEMWIAEGFVTPEKGETIEETANKYLEQLVQRSFVCVSKRSFLGTIKYCRVRQCIHEVAINESSNDDFLVVNPDEQKMKSMLRLAIHYDDKNQYTEVQNDDIESFIAFGVDRNVLGSAVSMRVLELRNSVIQEKALPNMTKLGYLGLRGCNISELPENIGDMKNLQKLDVRDTSIETLPESLWTISTLRLVCVNPSPQIKGPPSTTNISDLQILKTVVVHESWLENIPHFLKNLRKLALSNRDNPVWKTNPYWKPISILLSHMVNLLSMAIIGDIVPAEFVDTRAFPNLETVKSIKLEGEWNCRKLIIDNVKFPPNLTKLTLKNSGLKEDPMPTLERLQALKFLSLQDGAYTGNQMVCSANGFPQLQFLEFEKLENLENLEVKPMAMSQLVKLDAVECPNLKKPLNLEHVTIKGIDN